MYTIAIDFDGTLVESYSNTIKWRPGALQALQELKLNGHSLILWSARCTPQYTPCSPLEIEKFYATGEVPDSITYQWRLFEDMKSFLKDNNVWSMFDTVWTIPGKPLADYFIEDKSRLPNWEEIIKEF